MCEERLTMNLETPQTASTKSNKTTLNMRYHHHPGLFSSCDMILTFIPKSDCLLLVPVTCKFARVN